ncbi:MAG: MauE/DoxX family redox-associated membrane protein [Verrucomicrobiota bacterium]
MKVKEIASRLAFAAVGLTFLASGGVKVYDPQQFVSAILTYEVFSYNMAVLIALLVPFVEVVAGGLVTAGVWKRGATWVIGGMLVVFVVLIGQAWARGLSIDCGCFGSSEASDTGDYVWAIGRDLLLGAGLWIGWKFRTADGGIGRQ